MKAEHRIPRPRPLDADDESLDLAGPESTEALIDDLDNVMNFLRAPAREPRKAQKERGGFDLGAALDMVIRASEAMDIMERRSQEVQAQADSLVEQAKHDLLAAHERIASLQQRVLDALAREEEMEARLEEAEDRAQAADEWLARFHDTITNAFSARRAGPAAAGIRKAA